MEPPLKSRGCRLGHLLQLARLARSLFAPERYDPLIENCRARRNGDMPSGGAPTRFRADRENGSRLRHVYRFPSPVPVCADARLAPERFARLGASVTRPCLCRLGPSPARAALSHRVRVWPFSAIRG